MPKIVIKLGPNGERKTEAFGFKGDECKEKSAFLIDLFGEPEEDILKESFYEEKDSNLNCDVEGLPSGFCG